MSTGMNTTPLARTLSLASLVIASLTATGCSSEQGSGAEAAAQPARSEARLSESALTLERALRDVDRGTNLDAAGEAFRRLAVDPAAATDEKDQAKLGLSRVLELKGDAEGAVRTVEELLSAHSADQRFAARSEAEKRLRKLLTGADDEAPWLPDEAPVAPIAKALAAFFPPGTDGATQIDLLVVGGTSDRSDRLGTYNVAGALRELKKEACPLCSEDLSVHTSSSRTSSWTTIPMTMSEAGDRPRGAHALTVFYYDLGPDHIPSRYDQYLPVPGSQVDEVLKQGKGLVAVRPRDGAPPVIMIAAPRWGQLDKVEEAFSRMKELPSTPAEVELDAGLSAGEIRVVMRGARKPMRACYDQLLARSPGAAGKLVFSYTIGADGQVSDARIDDATVLAEPEFQRCMLTVVQGLQHPASGRKTTVTYPVALSPDR